MKYFLSFIFVSLVSIAGGSITFTKLDCSTSGLTCLNPFCSLRQLSNGPTAASFGCGSLSRKINKVQMKPAVAIKFLWNYYPINVLPEIEFCSYVKNVSPNSIYYSFFKTLNGKIPGLIHKCPYQNHDFQVRNLTLNANDLVFLRGEFKLAITWSDDVDKKLFHFTAYGRINPN